MFVLSFFMVSLAQAQGQKIELTYEQRKELRPDVEESLKNLITKFNGSFKGASIEKVYIDKYDVMYIMGKVKYVGGLCRDVETDYKIRVDYDEYSDEVHFSPSIYTPYCGPFGGVWSWKWDDKGTKYLVGGNMTESQKVAVANLIKEFLFNRNK